MNSLRHQFLPWIKVLFAQGLAVGGLWLIGEGISPVGPIWLLLQGVAAALIGGVLGLSLFWMPIQMLLPLAVTYGSALPAWAYLAAFVVCALVYWNSASEQVPLYLTNRKTWKALSDLVGTAKPASFVDLGSGMGGVVAYLAKAHPELQTRGVETAPLVFACSWIRLKVSAPANAQVHYRSIWDENLAAHDLVYCFLSPVPMPRMFEKAKAEMRKGSLFVSNSFAVPGQQATRILDVEDGRKTTLYVYEL